MLAILGWINVIVAGIAMTAPIAHVLEMPSKLTQDGPLWLGIQQTLYRGWGPVFAPVEIAALLTSLALVFLRRRSGRPIARTVAAAAAYVLMLAVFFVFNDPVNAALSAWTPDTMPADWPDYRLRWEVGHTITAILAVFAFVNLLAAWIADRQIHRPAQEPMVRARASEAPRH